MRELLAGFADVGGGEGAGTEDAVAALVEAAARRLRSRGLAGPGPAAAAS